MTLILRYLGILYLAVIGMNNTRKASGIYEHANLGSARDHLGRKAARFFSVQSRGTMTDFEITTKGKHLICNMVPPTKNEKPSTL